MRTCPHHFLSSLDSCFTSLFSLLRCQSCPGELSLLVLCPYLDSCQEYERAVIFRLGRLLTGGARGPGVFFVIPCVDVYEKIDMRSQTFEIPPQEVCCGMRFTAITLTLQILTKDSVTVFVNAIMYYKVANPIHAVANVDDYSGSARLLAATTLRNVLGTMTLGDILCQRENIAREMKVRSVF